MEKKTRVYAPHNKRYTNDQLLQILDDTIVLYKQSSVISYHNLLQTQCTLTKSTWKNYLPGGKYPNTDVQQRFRILKDLQEERIIEGAMNNNLNTSFSMFMLKCNHNYVEQQHRDKLAFEEKKLQAEATSFDSIKDNIQVTFSTVEHRSDAEIQKLLEKGDLPYEHNITIA